VALVVVQLLAARVESELVQQFMVLAARAQPAEPVVLYMPVGLLGTRPVLLKQCHIQKLP
jgi:hypothetical protein